MEPQDLQSLFEAVQLQRIFPDGKTFVDCIPKYPEKEIAQQYKLQQQQPGFHLKQFVLDHYDRHINELLYLRFAYQH